MDHFEYRQEITEKLKDIGIFCHAVAKPLVDVISVYNQKIPYVVDSEDWEVKKFP